MDYKEFINRVTEQDNRNRFGQLKEDVRELPEELRGFYLAGDPEDVEIQLMDLTSVKLYPYHQLPQLQEEYHPPKGTFVFATIEGDPLILKEGQVYAALHGAGEVYLELSYSSFDIFLEYILEEMK